MGRMASGANPDPTELTIALAALLRARSGEMRINGSEIGRRTGIPQSTMSRIMNAKRAIYLEHLDLICQVLELDMGEALEEARRRASSGPTPREVAQAPSGMESDAPTKQRGSGQVPSRPAHADSPASVRGSVRTRGGHK